MKLRLAILSAVLMLSSLFAANQATSRPSKEVETIYFDGPNFENEVGGRLLTCGGGTTRWGKSTRWYMRSEAPCDEGPGMSSCFACTLDSVCMPVNCPG
jgi:hypothetical protein